MKRPRLCFWIAATVLLLIAVALLAPQQIGVSLFKLFQVSLGGVVGYWMDRGLFPYARPDSYLALPHSCRYDGKRRCAKQADYPVAKGYASVFAFAMLRRAIIVGACMLAVGLGA